MSAPKYIDNIERLQYRLHMNTDVTSAHRMKKLLKALREQEAEYIRLRTEALYIRMAALMQPVRMAGAYPVRTGLGAREFACDRALEAKRWMFHLRALLVAENKKTVVVHGGRWSPAAVERNSR